MSDVSCTIGTFLVVPPLKIIILEVFMLEYFSNILPVIVFVDNSFLQFFIISVYLHIIVNASYEKK